MQEDAACGVAWDVLKVGDVLYGGLETVLFSCGTAEEEVRWGGGYDHDVGGGEQG